LKIWAFVRFCDPIITDTGGGLDGRDKYGSIVVFHALDRLKLDHFYRLVEVGGDVSVFVSRALNVLEVVPR